MSFLNPNYTEPCLSWCSSPFTPAAWRACTFQSSSPQINWVFFPSSHLLTSFGSQRLSLVELRLLEDGETVMHQTAGMSFGDSVLSAPLSPRCVQSHVRRFIRLTRALLRMISIFRNRNYTVFIIPAVWTVVTVAVFLIQPLLNLAGI